MEDRDIYILLSISIYILLLSIQLSTVGNSSTKVDKTRS